MKLFALAALAVSIIGCSSDNSNENAKPVPTTPFGKATAGAWISECQADDQGFFKETLTLDGVSAGTTANEYYADRACTQPTGNKEAPMAFSYKSQELSATHSIITVTVKIETAKMDVTITGNGSTMKVLPERGKAVTYVRIVEQAPNRTKPVDGEDGSAMAAFDRWAVGTWEQMDCPKGNNNSSHVELITISGGGAASVMYNVYRTGNCADEPSPSTPNSMSYKVRKFSGTSGVVEISGGVATVSFPEPTLMKVTNGRTVLYQRVR